MSESERTVELPGPSGGDLVTMPVHRNGTSAPKGFDALRAKGSIHRFSYRGGQTGWLVTDYHLARQIYTDRRFGLATPRPFPYEDPESHAQMYEKFGREGLLAAFLLAMDPPSHTRVRRVLARQFSADAVSRLGPDIQNAIDARLAKLESARGPIDLVAEFAQPISLATHCAMLGVPISDGPILAEMSEVVSGSTCSPEAMGAAIEQFRGYLGGVLARKMKETGDDVISAIIASGQLSEVETISVLNLLFLAGVDTTATMLSTGPFVLLCHPEQLDALRRDPTLIDDVVEELLRYLTISQTGAMTRTALTDVELEGVEIAAGDPVTISMIACNHDPARFPQGDSFDCTAPARGHVAFGHGPHVCLGQHVARLEMRLGISSLVSRFPEMELAVPASEIPTTDGEHELFAVTELPVSLGSTA